MVDQETLDMIKETAGYNDSEMEQWKRNPRNIKLVEMIPGAKISGVLPGGF